MEISTNELSKQIYTVRGHQVMLDGDLAESYGVETKTLKRAVKRNIQRFPSDFMFELTNQESENLRCQIGTSSCKSVLEVVFNAISQVEISCSEADSRSHGGNRYMSFAFTEPGVAMLSSVLHSERAIQVNIGIMRAFIQLRNQFPLISRIESLERRFEQFETQPQTQRSQDPVKLIQKIVAKHWGLKIEDLQSAVRKKSTTLVRHIAIYLIRNQLNMSFPEIGQYFGKRDHTSIMHAYHKISAATGLEETLEFLSAEIGRQMRASQFHTL